MLQRKNEQWHCAGFLMSQVIGSIVTFLTIQSCENVLPVDKRSEVPFISAGPCLTYICSAVLSSHSAPESAPGHGVNT